MQSSSSSSSSPSYSRNTVPDSTVISSLADPRADEPWYKPPSSSSLSPSSYSTSLSSVSSSTSPSYSSSTNIFSNTVSHNTLSFLSTNGVSIALMQDVRSVFNIPWYEYPFTLDCRPIQDQYIGTVISALPLPILVPVKPSMIKERLHDTVQRAIIGWLPADNFATATLFLPLEPNECHTLAQQVILPYLQTEFQQKQRKQDTGNIGGDSSPLSVPNNLTPEAIHIVSIIQLLVSGDYTPNHQPIFHYRWVPRTTATLFIQQYPFMSIGNNQVINRPGASVNCTPGTVNIVAIARTIPQLPFCILTEEDQITEEIRSVSPSSPSSPSSRSPKTVSIRKVSKRGALYVGSFEQASNVNVFTRLRIGAVVNVSMEKECPNAFETVSSSSSPTTKTGSKYQRSIDMPKKINYCRIPLADTTKSEFKSYIPTFIPFIEEHLSKGIPVLVHCHQGLSRSVTIILCYLMIQLGYPLPIAWSLFYGYAQNGRIARPNSGFQRQLIEMDEAIQKAEQDAVLQNSSPTG